MYPNIDEDLLAEEFDQEGDGGGTEASRGSTPQRLGQRSGGAPLYPNLETLEKQGEDDEENSSAGTEGGQGAGSPFEKDELAQCWYDVFREVGLPESVSKMYAIGFSHHGIDDENAHTLTDEDLKAHGVLNAQHRDIILRLIEGLLRHQREQEEAEQAAEAASKSTADQLKQDIDWDQVEKQRKMVQKEIDKVEELEENLAKILAGDTDRQRAFRKRLAKERAKRDKERAENRRKNVMARAQRAIERGKKDPKKNLESEDN